MKTFTQDEVDLLIVAIKEFNAGVVDRALDKHIDKCWKELKDLKVEEPEQMKRFNFFGFKFSLLLASLLCLSGCEGLVQAPAPQVEQKPSCISECPNGVCPAIPTTPNEDEDDYAPNFRLGGPKRNIEVGPNGVDINAPRLDINVPNPVTPRVEEHTDITNPNNVIGHTTDGVEIRGPVKTIYLEK